MRPHRFLAALAALWFTSTIPLPAQAQMGCADKTTCGPAQACVENSCRDPIRCKDDTECGNGLGCDPEQHRCVCNVDSDCGMSGTCERFSACNGGLCETGVCRANGQSPECGRACVEKAECPSGTICTFDDTNRQVGLCCQGVVGTKEEEFGCGVQAFGSPEETKCASITIFLACLVMGRIRRRSAATRGSRIDTQANVRNEP